MNNIWNMPTLEITLDRTIHAEPSEVFDAWLDPNHPGSPWYGVKRAIVQPQVDGFFYRMHLSAECLPDRKPFELGHYGRFVVVDRPSRIQHTWVSQHTRGLESVVTVDFLAQGANTLIRLKHEGIPDDEMGRKHEMGWTHYLGILANQYAKAA